MTINTKIDIYVCMCIYKASYQLYVYFKNNKKIINI